MRKINPIILISLTFITAYLFFRAVFAYSESKQQTQKVVPSVSSKIEVAQDALWSLIQDWRVKNGLKPYIKDQRLCKIAEDRSNDVPILDNHVGFMQKYDNENYPYVMQENLVALTFPKYMLASWLNSPPHKVTLEKAYTYSCVACDKQCVQIFSSFEK